MIGKFCVALALIPLAIILAALFEKPVLVELSSAAIPAMVSNINSSTFVTSGVEGATQKKPAESSGAPMGSGAMFDKIAWAYDTGNKFMSFGLDQRWREHLLNECFKLDAGDHVLDLATGTADVGILAGMRLQELDAAAADSVIGIDPSTEMLCLGVTKVMDHKLSSIVQLMRGDAQNLSSIELLGPASGGGCNIGQLEPGVTDSSIDKISMAFGIRNVPDRPKALREMRRVLRKKLSSRVCILEFSLPSGRTFFSWLARTFISNVIPMIGYVVTFGSGGAEYTYLLESIANFPQPMDFVKTMADAGLDVLSITHFAYGAVQLYTASPLTPLQEVIS